MANENAETEVRRELPKGWRWATLGEVARYINGRAFKPEEWAETGLPIVRIQNLNSDGAHFNFYPGEVAPAHLISDGDLLISWSASLDAFIWNGGRAVLNQHIFKVEEFASVIRRDYLFFAAKNVMQHLRSQVHGATMQHVTKPVFERTLIPLPSLEVQGRVAIHLQEELTSIEQAREAAQKQLKAICDLPATCLREVFESEEARTWPKKKLGEICSIEAKQVDPTTAEYRVLPHISGENIESGTGRLLAFRSAEEDEMKSGKYLFSKGDVLYSKLRPYLRKAARVDFDGLCSADMYPVQVNFNYIEPEFLLWSLLSEPFSRYAEEKSRRARIPKLNREELFAYQISLPPIEQQQLYIKRLAGQMASFETARQAAHAQLQVLEALPARLLSRAFSGFHSD